MPKLPKPYRYIIAVCILGSLLGTATSIATWTFHINGEGQGVSNFFYMFALPGWIPLYALGFSGIRAHPAVILLANGIAWSCWFAMMTMIYHLCSRARSAESRSEGVPVDLSRRRFLANGVVGAGAIAAVASPGYATLVEPWSIKVRRYTVPITGLPDGLVGLRLVQFSDSHLGPRIPESFIQHAVSVAADLRPDVLLLTGDYIHDGDRFIDRAAELCKPMIDAAGIGAVGVLGNHDWWGDGPRMSQALRKQGAMMIDNDRVFLTSDGEGLISTPSQNALAFVGLGDLSEDTTDIRRAFRAIDPSMPRILLSHQPDTAEIGSLSGSGAERVDLMFAGHTHGGQVRIPFIGTPLVPSSYGSKYAGGLVQGPRFPVCVSRGIGMSLLPVRFGVPPEIVEVTLTRA